MKAIVITLVSGACLAATGCTTSGEVDLDAVNALIAEFTAEEPGDPSAGSLGASVPALATYEVEDGGDTVKVSWNNGPLSGKTRTFVNEGPGPYVLDDPNEEGMLTVWRGTEYAVAASAGVIGNTSTKGAVGLAHAGIAPTDIPTNGTLTYGAEGGAHVIIPETGPTPCDGPAGGCVGDVNIAANFQTGAVNGTFSNFTGGISDIGFAGTMNSGNALYSSTSMTYGGLAANGKLVGGFYGPEAVDTAGVFDMTSSGTRYLGLYAASSAVVP